MAGLILPADAGEDRPPTPEGVAALITGLLLEEYQTNVAFRAVIDARAAERLSSTGDHEEMPKPEVYTVEEAAAYLKVAPKTIREWLKSGKLPGAKLGTLWRIREQDLEAMLTAKTPRP